MYCSLIIKRRCYSDMEYNIHEQLHVQIYAPSHKAQSTTAAGLEGDLKKVKVLICGGKPIFRPHHHRNIRSTQPFSPDLRDRASSQTLRHLAMPKVIVTCCSTLQWLFKGPMQPPSEEYFLPLLALLCFEGVLL